MPHVQRIAWTTVPGRLRCAKGVRITPPTTRISSPRRCWTRARERTHPRALAARAGALTQPGSTAAHDLAAERPPDRRRTHDLAAERPSDRMRTHDLAAE